MVRTYLARGTRSRYTYVMFFSGNTLIVFSVAIFIRAEYYTYMDVDRDAADHVIVLGEFLGKVETAKPILCGMCE